MNLNLQDFEWSNLNEWWFITIFVISFLFFYYRTTMVSLYNDMQKIRKLLSNNISSSSQN